MNSSSDVREDQNSAGHRFNSPDVEKWKAEFSKNFEDRVVDGDEAWGLFSSGGLSGQGVGHVMVFSVNDEKSSRIRVVPMGGQAIGTDKEVAGEAWNSFLKQVAGAESLSDVVKEGFDVYEYEYVNLKRVSGKVQVAKKLVMRAVDDQQNKEHSALIIAFRTIAK